MTRRSKTLSQMAGSGDDGSTGLLGGGRLPKDDLRIETYGTVDEASSAIGLARALSADARVREILEELQRGFYRLGAELASAYEDRAKFSGLTDSDLTAVVDRMAELEAEVTMPAQFILPGQTAGSGAIDVARTVVRRAERRLVALERALDSPYPLARRYLNRVSLLLFVLGRYEETRSGIAPKAARDPV
ncbi:MAG TPA: cob(I)yrinic acid a,c-diamide adenosyltransferase [Candidatus Acidoferrales bacterium]|nr:cob(I)yrinic acid a,c-diamide adenosyltransferase [Candidatus Acidoferrales bacterium]